MNKIIAFVIIALFIFNTKIAGQTTWQYFLDDTTDLSISDAYELNNGNIYFVGKSGIYDNDHYIGIILKINKNGTLIDSCLLSDSDTSIIISNILPDNNNDSSFILNASYQLNTQSVTHSGCKLLRIDTTLTVIQNKQYNFPSTYIITNSVMERGINDNVLVAGTIKIPPFGKHMYIYSFSMDFDSIKARFITEATIILDQLKQLKDSSFWVMDGTIPYYVHIDSDMKIISYLESGIPYHITNNKSTKWDTDTSFYLAGSYTALSKRKTDPYIGFAKQYNIFDSTGAIFNKWGAVDTLDYPAFFGALDYKNKDSIFIGGSKNLLYGNILFANIPSWYVLLQTDSMLNIRWEHFYGGDAYYNMTKLIATDDGGCIMAGTRFDYKAHPWVNERDIYIVKVNAEGLLTGTSKHENKFVHDAIVYPNPGSNALQVRVATQHPRSVFRLYDINGKLVMEHGINGKTARFNTTFLKAGTYVYSITGKNGLNESGKWVKQ